LFAFPLPPAAVFTAVFVSLVNETPLTLNVEVAFTTVTPAVADVITTSHVAVAAPPELYEQTGEPTKLPGPLTIDAVAVFGPASIEPPTPFTVICNV